MTTSPYSQFKENNLNSIKRCPNTKDLEISNRQHINKQETEKRQTKKKGRPHKQPKKTDRERERKGLRSTIVPGWLRQFSAE